jgi:preprotein translocase subunit SecE
VKISKLLNFVTEVRSEAYRISWPIMKDTVMSSLLVFIAVIISSLFFLMVDGAIYKSINYILTVGG